jgi:hypothetical protein
MSKQELWEAIKYLRTKLEESYINNGYTHERTIEIKKRLDLYISTYFKVTS